MARKILLADDDAAVREGLGRVLRSEGYETVLAGDGREAVVRVHGDGDGGRPDLVLMDVTMPVLDGLAATRRIRAAGSTVPILMLTGRDAVGDRIVALDNGADGYLMKPFATEELLARVRALLRRCPRPPAPSAEDRLVFDELAMDRVTRTVTWSGRPLELTKTEYALLEYLLRHPGRVLTRGRLLREVWGLSFEPASNTLDVYVMYLRRKLHQEGAPLLIHTIRGLGFALRR